MFAAVDKAFARHGRPAQFTDHPFCEECAEADSFFRSLTPEALVALPDPPETMPLSFLTDEAFLYLMPALARMMARTGTDHCAGQILCFVENKLHLFDAEQQASLRDLLYAIYERSPAEVHAHWMEYEQFWRILNRLESKG